MCFVVGSFGLLKTHKISSRRPCGVVPLLPSSLTCVSRFFCLCRGGASGRMCPAVFQRRNKRGVPCTSIKEAPH